jgi:oligopeptide/dipeptide ABC transporter ATP-binding protein
MSVQGAQLLHIGKLRTWFPVRRGVFGRTVGPVRAVDGVSLDVAYGETLALVGESGCGKSTLARSVMKLERPQEGVIRFEGRDIMALAGEELRGVRREMQMVFQDPFASLNPRMTVSQIVTEGLIEHGLIKRRERESEAVRLLGEVGLGREAMDRFPHEFSGGQRQRISLARALSTKPKLVIGDEPVSALDVSVQAQVINLLLDLRERHGLAYLFISHDLRVVRHLSDRIAVMYLGVIVEQGRTADVIDTPIHPYTRALVAAVPEVGGVRAPRALAAGETPSALNPPKGCRFHTRCPFAVDRCRMDVPVLETLPGGGAARFVACWRKGEV